MGKTSRGASSPSESNGFAVGLTGGIGSGKSAVASRLEGLGAAVVDSDAIARTLTAPSGEAIQSIGRQFGAKYIDANGALDRQRMRERVFSDPLAKATLESILHPRIRELAAAQAAATAKTAPYVIFVVPLLVESDAWRSDIDRLLVIDCSQATQEARVRARSQLNAALVRRIIAQQASRDARLAAADDVLVNEGTLEQLDLRARRLHYHYCDRARSKHDRL